MACIMIFTESWPILNKLTLVKSCKMRTFDLQLFNGEKTEDATPKRKEEARKKGQVAKSVEINSAFVILAAFLSLKVIGVYIYDELASYMRFIYVSFSNTDFTINFVQKIFFDFGIVFLKTSLPIMFAILITSILINFFQVGFNFSFEPLMPQLDRLNPLSGFKRIFSKRSLVELLKSIFKIMIVGYFIYNFIIAETEQLPKLIGAELFDSLKMTAALILDLVFQISGVMLVLAALDFFYQHWEHNQSLKMSKQELKEEYKQTEGNPQIKGKIKERQRAMAMRRMMQEVPKADVVVTNPTHFAVALKYDNTMAAPMIVAKGQDIMAMRIKDIAKEHRVTIVENKPLARALYGSTEVGDIVPQELYKSVAEVLAYVYRLKKKLS
ncbi:flagellar biosynthetic protein FlhB [Sporomusaceae bacterium FL31]|nr:flagellar biosynthetic protein FlhB [Sporomusaceae bacterium FL31]GCE32709.1 flagellar biosynthetic protein FlhB [Sporomusaceae bacterium]